jgi:hypothetical protein
VAAGVVLEKQRVLVEQGHGEFASCSVAVVWAYWSGASA